MDHRDVRKHFGTVAEHELQRLLARDHECLRRACNVLCAQIPGDETSYAGPENAGWSRNSAYTSTLAIRR